MDNFNADDIRITKTTMAVYQWPDIVPFQPVSRDTVIEKSFVQGVRVEMTQEKWDEIYGLYQAHYGRMQNPAVRDAWHQYRVVCALADKNTPVLLRK